MTTLADQIAMLRAERARHAREIAEIDAALARLASDPPGRVWTADVVPFKRRGPSPNVWPFVGHRTMRQVMADERGGGDAA